MRITCNGEAIEADDMDGMVGTVAGLLAQRLDDPRPHGIAVAVNDVVVPRAEWAERHLAEGDTVEIVTAVQGG